MRRLSASLFPLLLVAAATSQQSGRAIQQRGLPIVGQSTTFDLRYPASAAGNPFWFLYSFAPAPGLFPFVMPGFQVLGSLRIDPAGLVNTPLGILPAGTSVSSTLSIPNATGFLGLTLEVQGLDASLQPPTLAFTDNDLEVVVQGIPQWEPEQVLTGPGGPSKPILRAARNGRAVVAYQENSDLYLRTFDPTSGWAAPTFLHASGSPIDVGISSAGKVVVLYTANTPGFYNGLLARVYEPAGPLGPGGWSQATRIDDDQGAWNGARMAMAPGGECIVVWEQFWLPNGRSEVMGSRLAGTAWAAPLPVDSLNTGQAYAPRLAITDSGIGLVLFRWEVPDGFGGYIRSIRYCPYVYGVNLAQTFVSNSSQVSMDYMSLAVDEFGRAACFWQVGSTLWFSAYSGSTWTPPQPVSSGTGLVPSVGSPDLAMNSRGDGFLVWRQRDAAGISTFACPFGIAGSLGAPQVVENLAEDTLQAEVVVDDAGFATAAWVSRVNLSNPAQVWQNRFVPGVGWGTESPLESTGVGSMETTLAIDRQGDVHVAWTRRIPTSNDLLVVVRAFR